MGFSLDKILLDFVSNNWMSLYILITLIKGIALMTPNVRDDKIATLISQIYNSMRRGSAPECISESADPKIKEND